MTFSGKPSPASRAGARSSRAASCASRRTAARSRRRSSRCVSLNGDSCARVQDLVGVGVADAAEQVRIGERALERVVLAARARSANAASVAVEHLEPAGSCAASAASPRTTWSDARFFVPASVSSSVPVVEVERREADLARDLARAASSSAGGPRSSGGGPGTGRPSKPKTIRLPRRRRSTHGAPLALRTAGRPCAARTGSPGAAAPAAAPPTRGSSASR